MAMDMLAGQEPSVYPNSVYLLGFRSEWIFDAPFDTRPIDVGSPLESDVTVATEEERKAEIVKLVNLFEMGGNGITASE